MSVKKMPAYDKQQFKKKLSDIKEASGCIDCGANNHIILDFDHIRDKKYNVSRMIHDGFSWAAIKKEIEKCEVVCANCHRIRTHNRLTNKAD
jgi:hypothetical protein